MQLYTASFLWYYPTSEHMQDITQTVNTNIS